MDAKCSLYERNPVSICPYFTCVYLRFTRVPPVLPVIYLCFTFVTCVSHINLAAFLIITTGMRLTLMPIVAFSRP